MTSGNLDPANFEMSKIYQGNFQSLCRLAQLFLNTWAEKERNRWRIFFSSSENAVWSILLKYQEIERKRYRDKEIDVQIQAFTDEH